MDLGISYHAVEKRLKMARTKLGTTSSLEAARVLCEAEGYGQAVAQSPDLDSHALPPHQSSTRAVTLGVAIMILTIAIVLSLLLQPGTFSQSPNNSAGAPPGRQVVAPGSVPTAGTEAALRRLVAGLASGSPDYSKLSPNFAENVRRDLPMTHRFFASLGDLKSVTFRGRGPMADDVYKLAFEKGGVIMSAALDGDGRMVGGILQPEGPSGQQVPTAGTEAALRRLVAGLASGSPDYGKLSPQFAEKVRRDLPRTHRLFSSLGNLKSVTFRGRGALGDDFYNLAFDKGGVIMSAALDGDGRIARGILQPQGALGR